MLYAIPCLDQDLNPAPVNQANRALTPGHRRTAEEIGNAKKAQSEMSFPLVPMQELLL